MKTLKKLVTLSLVGVLALGLTACGGGDVDSEGRIQVKFIASGQAVEFQALKSIVEEYNETQGKTDAVRVSITRKDEYENYLQTTATGNNAPDIFYVNDRYFKSFAQQGLLADLDKLQQTTEITLDTSAMYPSGISRYRYDTATNTSNEGDPLYGIVRDVSPTIIYYNVTAFEKVGVICVSVPEEEIDDNYTAKFNEEHDSYFTKEHLKRGFVRKSVVESAAQGNYANPAYKWEAPDGDIMVFNNRIPMSWDEVEDLGKILTKRAEYNPNSPTSYGYYTWWWFYYGFSVGGDCIEDITGEGDWVFTLKDTVPNFIVRDDYDGTLKIGENTYQAGEIVSYRDRVKKLSEEKQKDILTNSSDLDETYLTDQVKELEEAGTLLRLPSERDAFQRFVNLAQEKGKKDGFDREGLEISPMPKNVSVTGDTGLFTSGKDAAMLVHKSNSLLDIQETIKTSFKWNVAPLPQYKEYNNDGTVRVHGVQGGASDSNAYCINAYSNETRQKGAMYFLKYLCSKEAQEFAAKTGFTLPSRPDSVAPYIASNTELNLQIIAEAAFYQTPGDWWYMPDKTWIDDNWASDLNSKVRNGTMTLEQFFNNFATTQKALNQYKR